MLAACLVMASALAAQHRGHFGARGGGAGGAHWGYTPRQTHAFFSHPIAPLYWDQYYYRSYYYPGLFYQPMFSYGLPYGTYGYAPAYPGSEERRPVVVIDAPADARLEKLIVYVPTYLRPDPGPPLGDIARALRAQRSR